MIRGNKQVSILIGVAGSGKSTWVKDKLKEDTLVLSSDAIREELFGTLDETVQVKDKHVEVFRVLNERLESALKGDTYYHIIIDAMNLNRRRRRGQYRNIKSWNKHADVVSYVFIEPISLLHEINDNRPKEKKIPRDKLRDMYLKLEVPRIEVDCDKLSVVSRTSLGLTEGYSYKGTEDILGKLPYGVTIEELLNTLKPSKWKTEWEMILDMPHDTPYHKESVSEHINMCINEASFYGERPLERVAQFHDLGKGYAKEWNEQKQRASYYSHANLGAVYFLKYYSEFIEVTMLDTKDVTMSNINTSGMTVLEALHQHMNAHSGIGDKNIRNNKLANIMDTINKFQEIDSKSRISDL